MMVTIIEILVVVILFLIILPLALCLYVKLFKDMMRLIIKLLEEDIRRVAREEYRNKRNGRY